MVTGSFVTPSTPSFPLLAKNYDKTHLSSQFQAEKAVLECKLLVDNFWLLAGRVVKIPGVG
jgi:hypothetical protein